jgi:hypothetical protein
MKKDNTTNNLSNEAANPAFLVGAVISSASKMPCGSNHSCHHCNGYYFGCTWISRMSEEEYEKHEQLVNATK